MEQQQSPEKEALHKAARVLGGQASLAEACGYSDRRHVWPWFNDPKRRVLPEKCPLIEKATRRVAEERGDQTLVVSCEELRPDVEWAVLRAAASTAEPAGQGA